MTVWSTKEGVASKEAQVVIIFYLEAVETWWTVFLCPSQVYDIAFSRAGGGRDMFASVGADGSVRMFDLRHLEHSTIIYEDPQHHPLLRLCWNKQDPNYLATMAMDGMEVSTALWGDSLWLSWRGNFPFFTCLFKDKCDQSEMYAPFYICL